MISIRIGTALCFHEKLYIFGGMMPQFAKGIRLQHLENLAQSNSPGAWRCHGDNF